MNKQREALKLALEALENHTAIKHPQQITYRDSAIDALRAALAEPEPVPICDKDPQGCWNVRCQLGKVCKNTTPPARKPLTDEEIDALADAIPGDTIDSVNSTWHIRLARAIEKAHGINEQ